MNKQITHEILMLATATLPVYTIHIGREPYLERYFMRENDMGVQFWLHRFLRNDSERHLHSHPGTAISELLCGEYVEETQLGTRHYSVGDKNVIARDKLHRIVSVTPNTWTLMEVQPDWLLADDWYFLDSDTGEKTVIQREPGFDWWKKYGVRV